jgi:hypothetical protein
MNIKLKKPASRDHDPQFRVFIVGFLSRTRFCTPIELKKLKSSVGEEARQICALSCDREVCIKRKLRR